MSIGDYMKSFDGTKTLRCWGREPHQLAHTSSRYEGLVDKEAGCVLWLLLSKQGDHTQATNDGVGCRKRGGATRGHP